MNKLFEIKTSSPEKGGRRSMRAGITCLLVVAATIISTAQKMPRALLLTGNGNLPERKAAYPPWIHEFHNPEVIRILDAIVAVDTTTDMALLRPDILQQYDLIISNSLFLTPEPEQLDALYRFVEEGKPFLSLHCGILSFLNWDRYERFMGGIFIGGPSSEPDSFRVYTTNDEFWGYGYAFRTAAEHPVSKVVDDFIIRDELYYFQPSTPDFHVIARAENHPVMWWHPLGRGRVMSLTLGHSLEAKENEGYRQLLVNGVSWLTGRPLLESPRLKPLSTRSLLYEGYINMSGHMHAASQGPIRFSAAPADNQGLFNLTSTPEGGLNVRLTGKVGTGTASLTATGPTGLSAKKDIRIEVIRDGEGNIASYHGNRISSSSSESQKPVADVSAIIDGDLNTRWSSAFLDEAWVMLDLQHVYPIGKVILHWEAAFASAYTLEVSKNGRDWKKVADIRKGDGETDVLTFAPVSARYIKVNATSRALEKWGYSLYEMEVYRE